MNRNEVTLQKMFSIIIEELRENSRWGTAHIYQATSNAFSAFVNNQELPLRKLNSAILKRFENHLRQRNCSWNTVSTYMKVLRAIYNRAVDNGYALYVPRLFKHVHTGRSLRLLPNSIPLTMFSTSRTDKPSSIQRAAKLSAFS